MDIVVLARLLALAVGLGLGAVLVARLAALRISRLNRWLLERPLVPVILALFIVLAGCLGPAGDEPEPGARDAPTDGSVPGGLESFGQVAVVKACPDPFLSILWPLEELQAHLPEGFVAAEAVDATAAILTPFWVPERVEADATPMGMIIVQVVLCQGGEDPRTHYREVLTGIAIETPDVSSVHGLASVEVYVLEHVIPTPWFAEMMAPIGWEFSTGAVIEGVVHEDLAPSATGRWTDADDTGYHVEMSGPAGSPVVHARDFVGRYWQVVPDGLAYFDHWATTISGVIPAEISCTTREGTVLYDLLGSTPCAHPDAEYAPFISYSHDPTLSFHYLPGATIG